MRQTAAMKRQAPFVCNGLMKAFTHHLTTDNGGAAIVHTIIVLAKTQPDNLKIHGCHEIQGYPPSHPLTAGEFAVQLSGAQTPASYQAGRNSRKKQT